MNKALKQKQRDDDLAAVVATPEGRRFLAALLRELNGAPFGTGSNETIQRLAALRDKAVLLEQRSPVSEPVEHLSHCLFNGQRRCFE